MAAATLLAASCAQSAPEPERGRRYWRDFMEIEAPDQGIFAAACAGTVHDSPGWMLDIYIMLDRSSSMQDAVPGGYRWNSVKLALSEFVQQPTAANMGVGLQYFPPVEETGYVCSWLTYEAPTVPIELLPDNAAALVASLEETDAEGNTPMSAALEGALWHAGAHAQEHPDRTVIVLLATDGLPTECELYIWWLENLAQKAYQATPSIRTFVIGVGGDLEDLHPIATAGGTTSALLIGGNNIANDLFDAVESIALENVDCTFALPKASKSVLDYARTAVQVHPSGDGKPHPVPHLSSCPLFGDGWIFEGDATVPETITLCDDSCARVMSDPDSTVEIAVPCGTS